MIEANVTNVQEYVRVLFNSPFWEVAFLEEKSEVVIGMDIESCVLFDPSLSRLDHDSLVAGHSLKNGRIDCCSCFTVPGELMSLPNKQCCCRCFGIVASAIGSYTLGRWILDAELPNNRDSFFSFNMGLEDTWNGTGCHVLSILDPIPRLPTLADVSGGKLCSSALEFIPWVYLCFECKSETSYYQNNATYKIGTYQEKNSLPQYFMLHKRNSKNIK